MSEEYGNDFVTLIDEDGNEVEFEHIDTVEYNGVTYLAFYPCRNLHRGGCRGCYHADR